MTRAGGDDRLERVVLVNERDEDVGVGEKLQVHRDGALHRAFSVFLLNADGAHLLQRRHPAKYHSGGLWSNTCCGHPRPGEPVGAAARRRLVEEMGIDCPLEAAFGFLYQVDLGELREHEYDHVFVGSFAGEPEPNAAEVSEWRWAHAAALKADLAERPELYTYWFRHVLDRVLAWERDRTRRP